jgi:peptidoglycan/LPS O-acetylase OafA/YrhL
LGHLTAVKNFLSLPIFSPLGKLNFSAYLIHDMVLLSYMSAFKQSYFIDVKSSTFMVAGAIVLSYLLAIPFCFISEVPFLQLEKLILFPPKKKRSSTKEKSNAVKEGEESLMESTKDGEESETLLKTNSSS